MIVDSSAVIAILNDEPDQRRYADALHGAERPVMAAPTLLEASIVAGQVARPRLDELIGAAGVVVVDFTEKHARVAGDAHLRYGKRSGSPARLNFGDCISYALAKVSNEPLLFKGDDFSHTDITPALPAD